MSDADNHALKVLDSQPFLLLQCCMRVFALVVPARKDSQKLLSVLEVRTPKEHVDPVDGTVVIALGLLTWVPDLLEPDAFGDELPLAHLRTIVEGACFHFVFLHNNLPFVIPSFHIREGFEHVYLLPVGSLNEPVDLNVLISVHKVDQRCNREPACFLGIFAFKLHLKLQSQVSRLGSFVLGQVPTATDLLDVMKLVLHELASSRKVVLWVFVEVVPHHLLGAQAHVRAECASRLPRCLCLLAPLPPHLEMHFFALFVDPLFVTEDGFHKKFWKVVNLFLNEFQVLLGELSQLVFISHPSQLLIFFLVI